MTAVDRLAYHSGACGCVPNSGMVESDNSMCGAASPLSSLCETVDAGHLSGACIAQGFPSRDAGAGAQNCGTAGNTCDPSKGGLNCVQGQSAGVGVCACNHSVGDDYCLEQVQGGGRGHVVSGACVAKSIIGTQTDQCRCGAGASCNPNDATHPDCCGSACTNMATDSSNCGACGSACGAGLPVACGTGTLAPGQCACAVNVACPSNGGGGGQTCAIGGVCQCAGANGVACGIGTTCNSANSAGCCEWGFNVAPNSCIPPVIAVMCSPPDQANPKRRVCYTAASLPACCVNGCNPDGTCAP